jgi:hypothetical protein
MMGLEGLFGSRAIVLTTKGFYEQRIHMMLKLEFYSFVNRIRTTVDITVLGLRPLEM